MKTETVTIPQSIQAICKKLAETARELGLREMSGKFQPPHDLWGGEVTFNWKQGRHGEDANEINIVSNFYIFTTITDVKNT